MPKKYRVKITRRAEEDVESIYTYIHRDGPQAALDFVSELERQISSLEGFPLRCPTIPEASELGISYRHILYGEYRTVFRVDRGTVYILRVIHGARLLDLRVLE
ncbi:MAG: type II toxin-antitoxin system RelE/ParE family toxin [Candidatus Manganitrophaceae bacterium]